MRLSVISLAVVSQLVLPAVYAADSSNIEKISVVGSRLAVRSATDTAVPVDIISAEQLEATGMTETAKALQFAAPSYSFPSSSVTDGTDAVRPASLRGLSPDHTLVLVNGKRYHGSALVHLNGTAGRGSSSVDLNTIPMSAIKRIEILRDGASAQYGSDAIAGVINIVLKDASEGAEIALQGGQTYAGDGEQWRAGLNKGIKFSENGHVDISLEAHHKNPTNRAGLDQRQQYPTLEDGSADPREATFDRKNHQIGDGKYENLALFFNGAQYFGDDKLYFFGGISHRENESGAFYRRALDSRNILEIYPDGFLPQLAPKIKDYSATVGYAFSLGEWKMDAAAGFGRNDFEYYVKNSLNASYGPDSQTRFYDGTLTTEETNLTLDASRYLPFYNDSELLLALGVAYRNNTYQIEAGEEASYANGGYGNRAAGSQGFTGFTPASEVDESRHNTGLYAEVENQLTRDFYWAAAVRYEDYSDFGGNTTWKLAGRYDLTDKLAFRATANTGFRAPSVQQLYFTNISTLFVSDPDTGELVPTESGTFNSLSPVAQALGISELKPEKSTSFSGGLVYTGDNGMTITLDAYQIDIDDRIILSSSLTPSDSAAVAEALSGTNAESARFFINGVDTRTKGVDLVVSQNFELGSYGDLAASMVYAYNKNEIRDIHLPSLLGGLEDQLFDHVEQVRMTDSSPQNKGSLNLTHSYGDFKTNLRFNFFGDYKVGLSTGENLDYGAKTTTDLSVAYTATDHLTLTLGAQNLFDVYPDKAKTEPTDQSFGGIFKYPVGNTPFGMNGGYYYLQARYTF